MPTQLRLEALDGRDLPASVGRLSDAYAWSLINELRRDPAGFADRLHGLRTGSVPAAFGFAKSDPVVRDLGHLLSSSVYPGHYRAALKQLRSSAATGPLAWDDLLASRAAGHVAWMRTHSFEHTAQDRARKSYIPGFNTGYRGGDPDVWGYPAGAYAAWGENIGYTYGLTTASKAAYKAGRFGLVGFQQRAAFIDTISYVIEVNSPNMAHLNQLLAPAAGGLNAIGIDASFYEAPGETRDGIGEATLSTHRLGLAPRGDGGGFLAGLVYRDGNGNGRYDSGEGMTARVTVAGPASYADDLDPAVSRGVYSRSLPPGTYTVTAVAGDGTPLGARAVTVAGGNAWFEFAVPDAIGALIQPSIPSPTAATGVRPTITWPAVADAVHYRVRLTDVTANRADVFPGAGGPGAAWTPPTDLVPGHIYRVAVRASTPYLDGEWSAAQEFAVPVPQITLPAGPVATLRPTLFWSAVPGAAGYDVRVVDARGVTPPGLGRVRTTGTEWTVPADLVSGLEYRVRVRAVNARDRGDWSVPLSFRVATPTPTTTIAAVPTFSWTAVAGTTRYSVELIDRTTGRRDHRVSTTNLSWVPAEGIMAGHRYQWRVRAENADGLSRWSSFEDVETGG